MILFPFDLDYFDLLLLLGIVKQSIETKGTYVEDKTEICRGYR